MSAADPTVIVSATRTPMGGFQGALGHLSAPELGAVAISAAVEKSGVQQDEISELLMGCVLSAGVGQAPARQAALKGGLPNSLPCSTISKVCGSGMKAVMLANDQIQSGSASVVVAGGMESMTNAPYLLDKARGGYRLGHGRTIDHMFYDGLEDAYEKGTLMGEFAERTAQYFQFTRQAQDDVALRSLSRANDAIKNGRFDSEVAACKTKSGELFRTDEQPGKAKVEKIPALKPAFDKNGTVTAANSSSISDGAAALVMMRLSEAEKRGVKPLAMIRGHSSHAQEPQWFTTAPVGAIEKLLQKTGWRKDGVDLYEINEAFAVVLMAVQQQLSLSSDSVNIHGGACALGHPIGASGARILVTLIHALKQYNLSKGIASLCIGGGEATAVAVEIV